jgi:hypothetical protein
MTPDNVKALTAPFEASEHEFLRGMTYLTESAITRRLDEVDPAWSFRISLVEHRADKVVVYAALTVQGVTRESNGMEASSYAKGADHIPENETNYPEKAAVTDALKRCARLFGIGRYILDLPENVKDLRALAAWLNSRNGSTPAAKPAPKVTPKATAIDMTQEQRTFTDETAREFVISQKATYGIGYADVCDALNVKDVRDWMFKESEAHAAVAMWVQSHAKDKTA